MAHDLLADHEWACFQGFIRAIRQPKERQPVDHRPVLDGMIWIARTGAPWRDLAEAFGGWSQLYRQFQRGALAGLWEDILDALSHAGIAPDRLRMIDNSAIRAHQYAAGAKKGTPKQALGHPRDGFSTKIHLRVNDADLPLRREITPGQESDHTGCDLAIADSLSQPDVLGADRRDVVDINRQDIESRDALPMIPMRKLRKIVDMTMDRLRKMVERCFNKLKNRRRLESCHDNTAASFFGFVDMAGIRLWHRHSSPVHRMTWQKVDTANHIRSRCWPSSCKAVVLTGDPCCLFRS